MLMNMKLSNILILFKNIDDGDSITDVAKKTNITYSHIYKIIKYLESEKIIITEKNSRDRTIFLTGKGLTIKAFFNKLNNGLI